MVFHKYLGDSKMFEYYKHYRECQQQNVPFIKAKTNPIHGNYYVQIDLMTCNYNLTKQEQNEIKKLIEKEIEYVQLNSDFEFKGFSITNELAWFDGIPSEHVDDFCNDLYDLTHNKHN